VSESHKSQRAETNAQQRDARAIWDLQPLLRTKTEPQLGERLQRLHQNRLLFDAR